jgi:hypothetical protein
MGSLTPQGREALALSHLALLRSGLLDAVRSLIRRFRSSIPSPHMPLSNASSAASRPPSHGSGPGWFAIPYLYDFFHHCSTPVYPDAIPEVRALSSAGIARPHRSYGPLRLPDWPSPFLATFGAATPSQSRASLTDPDHLPYMPCSIPRWTGSGARWLASGAFPRRVLPCPYSLPRYRGGSASTSLLSRPAQASHALRPAELLTYHT